MRDVESLPQENAENTKPRLCFPPGCPLVHKLPWGEIPGAVWVQRGFVLASSWLRSGSILASFWVAAGLRNRQNQAKYSMFRSRRKISERIAATRTGRAAFARLLPEACMPAAKPRRGGPSPRQTRSIPRRPRDRRCQFAGEERRENRKACQSVPFRATRAVSPRKAWCARDRKEVTRRAKPVSNRAT